MFKKAVRKQAKLKIALTGLTGGGKTYSSLLIAKGLVGEGGKIAMLDTEMGSGSLYCHLTDYDTLEVKEPYAIKDYVAGISAAEKAGYDCLIIDSLTHAWKYILAEKEKLDQRGGNSFTNWGKMTPKHQELIDAVLHSNIHIIATMRSKMDYSIDRDSNGRNKVTKLGLAPVQREDAAYEFSIVFDMARTHQCEATKDRTGLFDQEIFIPTVETGEKIRSWLEGGEEVKEAIKPKEDEIPEFKPKKEEKEDVNIVKEVIEKKDSEAFTKAKTAIGNATTPERLIELADKFQSVEHLFKGDEYQQTQILLVNKEGELK